MTGEFAPKVKLLPTNRIVAAGAGLVAPVMAAATTNPSIPASVRPYSLYSSPLMADAASVRQAAS